MRFVDRPIHAGFHFTTIKPRRFPTRDRADVRVFAEKLGAVEAGHRDRLQRSNLRFDQKLNFAQVAKPYGNSSGGSKG